MKIYQAITILILVSYIYTVDYCENEVSPPTKVEDCTSHKANGGYCCFVKSKGGDFCDEFGPKSYKYISDYAKLGKKCNRALGDDCEEDKDYSIDCKSSYLVLSLLSFILLFL
jgi:hypothetical protein